MDKKTVKEAEHTISSIRANLEVVRDDEQEKYDEKSDTWKESEAGQKAEEVIGHLTDAIDTLESVETSLDEAIS